MDKTYTIGTDWVAVGGGESIGIYNGGDSAVYYRKDTDFYRTGKPWEYDEAPISTRQTVHIDLVPTHKGFLGLRTQLPIVYLICQSGTATVRVFRWKGK